MASISLRRLLLTYFWCREYMSDQSKTALKVAESYDSLQSIAEIQALSSLAEKQKNISRQTLCALRSCFDILFLNIRDIVQRNLDTIRQMENGFDLTIAHRQIWIRDLLDLGLRLSEECRAQTYECGDTSADAFVPALPSIAFDEMQVAVDTYCSEVKSRFDPNKVRHSVAYKSQFSALSNMFHMLKVNYHNLRCLKANLTSSVTPKQFASKECFEIARRIADYPRDIGDTFLQQFCLLHQIPELLGRIVVSLINQASALNPEDKAPLSICLLSRAERLISVCVHCLRPLTNELLPFEYSKIRHYLGVTSGSQSDVLSIQLLHSTLSTLGGYRKDLESGETTPQRARLAAVAFRVFDRLQLWRDLHLHLPRNVLGLGDVRSLIGSKEAVSKVEDMSTGHSSIAKHNQLTHSRDASFKQSLGESIDALDKMILSATGMETKSRFKQVQERTGIYAKPPRKPDEKSE